MNENENFENSGEQQKKPNLFKRIGSALKQEWVVSFCNLPLKIMLAITLLSVIVSVISVFNMGFAESYSMTVGRFFRMVMAKITGVLPFSLAETLLVATVVLLFYSLGRIIWEAIRKIDYEKRYEPKFNRVAAFCVMIAFTLYNFSFAPCNRRVPVGESFGLEAKDLSAQEIYDCLIIVQDELHELLEENEIRTLPSGSSISPYSFEECNKILNEIYAEASKQYPFIDGFSSRVKQIALSEPMTYTHIAGIYIPFTGEANINTNYPDYVSVFSMGHEMAHQRGVAREDEANFVAFKLMYESDDAYLRYCALTELFVYLTDTLSQENEDLFLEAFLACDDRIVWELVGYTDFFRPYSNSKVSTVANAINDASIKLRGDSDGTKSYNMMIELAVAYFKNAE